VYLVLPNPYLLGLTLLVATSFTLLWISHIFAFTFRTNKALKAVRDTTTEEGEKPLQTRREFVPTLGRLALLSYLFRFVISFFFTTSVTTIGKVSG
jgi:hypothetical protein